MLNNSSTLAVYKSGITMFTNCVLTKLAVHKPELHTTYAQFEQAYTHYFTQAILRSLNLLHQLLYTLSTGLITITVTYINKLIIRDADKSLAY